MWIEALRSRGFETGSVAIELEPLGHSRFGGQGRTDTNRACADLVQGACRCLASPFRREGGESVQAGLEEWSATRWWSDSERSLVCGQTLRRAGRHRQTGTSRSSSQLRAPLPRMWRRTRTDSVSAWPRLGTNDRTVHRVQAKPQRSRQRSIRNLSGMRCGLKKLGADDCARCWRSRPLSFMIQTGVSSAWRMPVPEMRHTTSALPTRNVQISRAHERASD
jgi:hypothetical protein